MCKWPLTRGDAPDFTNSIRVIRTSLLVPNAHTKATKYQPYPKTILCVVFSIAQLVAHRVGTTKRGCDCNVSHCSDRSSLKGQTVTNFSTVVRSCTFSSGPQANLM